MATHVERIDHQAREAESQATRASNNARQALQGLQENTNTLRDITTRLDALPNLLAHIRTLSEQQLNTMKALKESNDINREFIMAIDNRLTKISNEETATERSESRASIRTDVFEEPPQHQDPRESPTLFVSGFHRSTHHFLLAESPYLVAISPLKDHERAHVHPSRDNIPKGAKAKKPEPFEGKKRDQEAEVFLMKMEMYFNDYPGAFSDKRKISATLTNIMKEGDGTQWAKPLLRKLLDEVPHYSAFKEAFLLAFGDPIKKDRANTEAVTLEQWIELAIKMDDILFATRGRDGSRHNGTSNAIQGQQGTTGEGTNQPKKKNLSDKEFKRRMDEKLCIKCTQKGHRKDTCRATEWNTAEGGGVVKGKAVEVQETKEEEASTSLESEN
ncbi:hypothetical protein FRC10_004272 [Ceratobasidium sp. 414]|nr:hypothetical protein FRC10_004272 [Ceratobasidium sp. 414]